MKKYRKEKTREKRKAKPVSTVVVNHQQSSNHRVALCPRAARPATPFPTPKRRRPLHCSALVLVLVHCIHVTVHGRQVTVGVTGQVGPRTAASATRRRLLPHAATAGPCTTSWQLQARSARADHPRGRASRAGRISNQIGQAVRGRPTGIPFLGTPI